MRVVALLSGGKDSCYSILKARAHGHTVVALAHITPPPGAAEPDSYMYQSVGSGAVPALARALDLPLVTRATHARARATGLAYAPTPGDEVEDLAALLRDVVAAVRGVQAVCAGALWSDYQRLRVESAAARAGLLSLAYLWRRGQRALLDEMLAAGVEAVVIKVAGIGLRAEHLGRTLAQLRPTLHALEDRFGSHVCGEGGEYETLVLAMPSFSHRLVLDKTTVVHHVESDIAPVAYLQVDEFHLELRDNSADPPVPAPVPPVPLALRPLPEDAKQKDMFLTEEAADEPKASGLPVGGAEVQPKTSFTVSGEYAYVVVLSNSPGAEGVSGATAALHQRLKEEGFALGDILYVWLNLETVKGKSYAEANKAYCSVFDVPECIPPPSRACVAMPNGSYPVSIEAIARRSRREGVQDSRTLHVQSLSEWAPPCIGPYAQVVEDCGITFVSGALAMHAPNASIQVAAGIRAQTRGCLFNIRRTLEATRSDFGDLGFFVAYTVSPDFFGAIHEEFWKELGDSGRAVLAVVPCIGLPKNALVEIRAVGSYGDSPNSEVDFKSEDRCKDLLVSVATSKEIATSYVVRYGNLMFAEVFVSSEKATCSELSHIFCAKLDALEEDYACKLLSTQVYILEEEAEEIERSFASETARSLNMIRSPWLPGRPRVLGVVTLTCSQLVDV